MYDEDKLFLELLKRKKWVPLPKLRRITAIFDEFRSMGAETSIKDFLLARQVLSKEQIFELEREVAQMAAKAQEESSHESSVAVLQSVDLLPDRLGLDELSSLANPREVTLKAGTTFGRYKIGRELGQGGMATVYEAWDTLLKRQVAMKVLTKPQANQKTISRFLSEAQATAQLQHPNIIPIHDIGWTPQKRPFFTMDIVRGHALNVIIESLAIGDPDFMEIYPLSRLLQIFLKICEGVAYAHSKGVIHRDLKPENIMVGAFGEVYIMDWGLAKFLKSTHSGVWTERQEEAWTTQAGAVVGTPIYMAPEQARGEIDRIDERTDVYALGAILYELITLRPPFIGETLEEVYHQVLGITPAHPRTVAIGEKPDETISAIALKALAKSQVLRYQSVADLKRDVQNYLAGKPLVILRETPLGKIKRWLRHYKLPVIASTLTFGIGFFLASLLSHSAFQQVNSTDKIWKMAFFRVSPVKVEKYFSQILEKAPAPQKPQLLWDQICYYLYQGEVLKAKALLAQKQKQYGLKGKDWFLMAMMAYYEGERHRFIESLKKLAHTAEEEEYRDFAWAVLSYTNLPEGDLSQEKFQSALHNFQKLSQRFPQPVWVHVVIIDCLLQYLQRFSSSTLDTDFDPLEQAKEDIQSLESLSAPRPLLCFLRLQLILAERHLHTKASPSSIGPPVVKKRQLLSAYRAFVLQKQGWPNSGYVDYLKGLFFYYLEEHRLARNYWKKAIQKSPNAPWVQRIRELQ